MVKAIWMSDLHFACEGEVLGHDPQVRLQMAMDHINNIHSDADLCIVSGDMVNRGTLADYQTLSDKLKALSIPFFPMVGNHDDRDLFRQFFPLPKSCMADFIQYAVSTPLGLLVCLDTLKPGSDGGELCHARLAWLEGILQKAAGTPVYIFMHHPPMSLGLPMQDTDGLEDGGAFLELITKYDFVEYLFIGHVHRPISGTVKGIPFSTMRSILYQAPAPQPDWNWDTFKPSEEAPNIGVITISDTSVTLQYEQFCKYEDGVRN